MTLITKSIKFRLALWYFLAFFVSAVIIFFAFYFVTRQILLQQTDREITLHTSQIEAVINQENVHLSDSFPESRLSHQFAEMPGMLVAISDGSGKILTISQTIGSGLPVVADTLEKSSGVIRPAFINRTIGSVTMRIGIFPVIKNNLVSNIIMVGHPLNVISDSLNRLLGILVVVLLLVGLPVVFGAYFLAGSALRPVTNFSKKLKQITAANLDKPVANPGTGDELEELADSFNSLLSGLSASFTRERQFIGDVAHELKTPLSVLKSTIDISLSKKRSGARYQSVLADALADIDNLSSTVNDVLDLARAQSGDLSKSFTPVDLSGLVGDVTEILEKMAGEKSIRVVKEITPGITVTGNRQMLFRALFNLADNAVKYTPAGGDIAVTLELLKSVPVLEITNSGSGIPRADLPHIFDRFYRGRHLTPGSGLGLAICKTIISSHGGKISVVSIPRGLTTFRIGLPS